MKEMKMSDEVKVYGFGEAQEAIKPSTYTWPGGRHLSFDRTIEDTVQNQIRLYRELEEFMFEHAKQKVIFMRIPPEMHSATEFESSVKMVRLYCRFSVAKGENDDS